MNAVPPEPTPQTTEDERAPVLGRWKNIYAVVIAELAVTVVVLYALTRWAS